MVLERLAWQLPCSGAMRQLGVEVNPPPDPVTGISGGGTVSVVAVGVESTPGSTASGAPGTARTTGGNSGGATGGPISEANLVRALLSGGSMRGTMATSGMPSASA